MIGWEGVAAALFWLAWGELGAYLDGYSEEHFHVQLDEGHGMQINLDMTVAMPCERQLS